MRKYLHYLRIAWSVGCAIACVLLIALWIRSYWRYDYARKPIDFRRAISFTSHGGYAGIRVATFKLGSYFPQLDGTAVPIRATGWQIGVQPASGATNNPHFDFRLYPYLSIEAPHWFLVLITAVPAAIGAAPWIRQLKLRFSLRTLLIATTLVCVGARADRVRDTAIIRPRGGLFHVR
jgi:hypothetical protein